MSKHAAILFFFIVIAMKIFVIDYFLLALFCFYFSQYAVSVGPFQSIFQILILHNLLILYETMAISNYCIKCFIVYLIIRRITS